MLRIASVNVNGIRAAARKGMQPWLDASGVDVLCLQEVRASDEQLAELLPGWQLAGEASEMKGRAGVAVALRPGASAQFDVDAVRIGLGLTGPAHTGRWVEVDLDCELGDVTVVSAYIHSGEVDTPKQDAKYEFLRAMTARLAALRAGGRLALVAGDFNIAHREVDIKNWKGNVKNAGFLPEERAYLDGWFAPEASDEDGGWVDLGRALGGDGPGPYTWWSWRGKAFDNDTGWRIDYQIATPPMAARATQARVEKADAWDARWSDHAPLVVDFA